MEIQNHGEQNIGKHLIVGLIYPAVLGTVIYLLLEYLGKHFLEGKELVILQSSLDIIIFKVILLLVTLLFYACDFLYTTYTKPFRILYFCFDIVILVGLFTTFKATNYDNAELPLIQLILGCFIIFMVLYFIWDYYESFQDESKSNQQQKNMYAKMIRWEIYSFASFLSLLLLSYFDIIGKHWTTILSTIAISISTFIFIRLVRQKRNLFFQGHESKAKQLHK